MILQKIYHRLTSPCFPRKLRHFAGRIFSGSQATAVPVAGLDELNPRQLLLILAHPDDEIFCSGLVCDCVAREAAVSLLCLSSGEGGITGGHPREQLGAIRRDELRDAAAKLGISSVEFLGYIDPLGTRYRTYPPAHDPAELRAQVRQAVRQSGADTVVTHGSDGEYWHPAHFVLHDTVREVLRDPGFGGIRLLTINAWNPAHPLPKILNRSDPAQLAIDGAGHRNKRLAALRCHASQSCYFEQTSPGGLEGFIDATAQERYRLWDDSPFR